MPAGHPDVKPRLNHLGRNLHVFIVDMEVTFSGLKRYRLWRLLWARSLFYHRGGAILKTFVWTELLLSSLKDNSICLSQNPEGAKAFVSADRNNAQERIVTFWTTESVGGGILCVNVCVSGCVLSNVFMCKRKPLLALRHPHRCLFVVTARFVLSVFLFITLSWLYGCSQIQQRGHNHRHDRYAWVSNTALWIHRHNLTAWISSFTEKNEYRQRGVADNVLKMEC